MAPHPSSRPLLQVARLDFGHPGQPPLFRQWSATIGAGLTWVVGGEGRGKTSLLRLLAGKLAPAAGQVVLHGDACSGAPASGRAFLAELHGPEHDALPARELVRRIAGHDTGFDEAALAVHVAGLGLADHWHKPMAMLSTGSRRKVWHAAVLASSAPLRLLDMPFAALDNASIRYLVATLEKAAQDPGTAWVLADYVVHPALPGAAVIDLGE